MPVLMKAPVVPEPGRVRRIGRSFAWLDHRLSREGYLERMSLADLALYVFLVLAADRDGVSFYRKEVISEKLAIDWGQFEQAKRRLIAMGLIAFHPFSPLEVNGFYQVLPLPQGGCHDAGSVG